MPPHPSLRGLSGISQENSDIRPGGIKPTAGILPKGLRPSISSVGTKVNRILVLRTPFTEGSSFTEHDSFTVGAASGAYAAVEAQVEQYYLDQSRGLHPVDLSFPDISTAVKFSQSHSNYGSQVDPSVLENGVLEVLALWDVLIDFSNYDSVIIMHAGNGQEVRGGQPPTLIHSFRSTFTNPYDSQDGVTVFSYVLVPEFYEVGKGNQLDAVTGVIVHEYGHELGLPDLYDASPSNFNQGIGDWGVMSGGSFGGPDQVGTVPVGFCAWSKLFLGWVTPLDAVDGATTLVPPALGGNVLRIQAEGPANPQEYFLLENRYNGSLTGGVKNWDQYLPLDNSIDSTGILILHVDESRAFLDAGFGDGSNRWDRNRIQTDASRKFLDVEEASTAQDLDGSGGVSNADDAWSLASSQTFGPSGNFLAEPYSGNPNGVAVDFSSAQLGESMNISVTQGFQVLAVDSSQPGTLLIDFTGTVMDSPSNSSLSFDPSLGNLQVSKITSNRIQVLYDGSLMRTQPTTLSFSGFQSQSGATPSNLTNFAGTTVSRYILEGTNTWTEAKSPYLIEDGDILLESSSTLVLESGTVLLLGADSSGSFPSTRIDITILGSLKALGTATKPVKILSTQSGRENWGTLFFGASQDKPSFLNHVLISGGGFGSSGPCVEIRDRSEHVFAHVTWTECNFGVRIGQTYPSQKKGIITGGGGRPRIYNSVFEKLSRGILIDSANADVHLIYNFFQEWDSVAVNFRATDKASLNHLRFTEFLVDTSLDSPFEFANTASDPAHTLVLGDLHEFYTKRDTTTESLIQLNPNSSIFSTEQNSLSDPVSRDWTLSKLSFLDPALDQEISSIKDGDSFRIQAEASSATNFNATTQRLLAVSLEADSVGQKILAILQESALNSKTFLSQPISTSLSGRTSSTHLMLDTSDTLRASALGSSGLITTIAVNPPPSEPTTLSLTPIFINNRLELSYGLSVPSGKVVSQVRAEYSTDGESSWILSTELGSLSTAPTQSLTWFAFRELGVGFTGDVSLRLTSLSENSASVSTVSTFSHQIQTQSFNTNYSLESGWNLISVFPLPQQTPGDYFSVFESSMTSCAYSYYGGGFYHFCPDSLASAENSTSTALSSNLTQGQSFWVKSSILTTLAVSSSFDPRIPIDLEAGWNLLSLGYSGATTPTHLDNEIQALFDFQSTPPPGFYQVSYPSSPSTTHSTIETKITNFSQKKGTWIYSRNKTTLQPYSLP